MVGEKRELMAETKLKKGNTNRTKGHNAERHYMTIFKELGFDKCVTARYGSRQHDDASIDLINIPLNVQIKAGKQRAFNPVNILMYMAEKIKSLFPSNYPEHDYPNIIILRKEVGKGKKRTQFDDMVYMSFDDFSKILKKVKWES